MKNILKKLGNIILNILVFIAIIFLIFSVYVIYQIKLQNKQYASIFGYTALEVVTGSMSGTIEIGDLVIVELTKDVDKGDIIVYSQDDNLITHRVIETNEENIITKGDSNNTEDKPITKENVVGKVIHIVRNFGIIKDVFSSPLVLVCIGITIFLFGIVIIYKPEDENKKDIKNRKNKKSKSKAEEKVEEDEKSDKAKENKIIH